MGENRPARVTVHGETSTVLILFSQAQLWSALKAGHIDMVVSDHSPCTPDLKNLDCGDFIQAWGGISSLQFGKSIQPPKIGSSYETEGRNYQL